MSNSKSEPQPQTPPVFSLASTFDYKRVQTAPKSNTDFFAIGLNVDSITNETIESIYKELLGEEIKSNSFSISPGNFGVYIDKREIFDKICNKIDSLLRINSPQEFFYAVSVAIEVLNMFENSGPKIGNTGLSELQNMLKELLKKQQSTESIFDPNT